MSPSSLCLLAAALVVTGATKGESCSSREAAGACAAGADVAVVGGASVGAAAKGVHVEHRSVQSEDFSAPLATFVNQSATWLRPLGTCL